MYVFFKLILSNYKNANYNEIFIFIYNYQKF